MGSLADAAIKFAADLVSPEDLPDIAAAALVDGLDSPALRELAGLPRHEVREVRDLFAEALRELNIPIPLPDDRVPLARLIASQIVTGKVSPIEGARAIWWRCCSYMERSAEWEAWSFFVGAASEWDDYPPARDELATLIKKEAALQLREPQDQEVLAR
ncbi:hypothetical protein ABZ863_21030 [Saccharomonospora sp. NPDC046836]|uniref:hypothetical protein n=1 Tax=Saccharomonospora sp. NPDC046836 TaxID=3156921 RepID=UPI0033EE9C64